MYVHVWIDKNRNTCKKASINCPKKRKWEEGGRQVQGDQTGGGKPEETMEIDV
jgi:hypothetical protein